MNYCEQVLLALQLPEALIRFLLWSMRAPYLYSVSGGYVEHIRRVPLSGTRQGDGCILSGILIGNLSFVLTCAGSNCNYVRR